MGKKNLKQSAESTMKNLKQATDKAMRKLKQVVEQSLDELKNMKNSTKIKLGAGLMSGLMLTSGFVGCARVGVNESIDRADTDGTKIEDTVKPGELDSGEINITETETGTIEVETYPVIDQSVSEKLELIGNQMAQLLTNQGVSDAEIAKLMAQISKCTTEEQMQEAINAMRVQIEKYISAEIDKKLTQMEQQSPNQNNNNNIQFGTEVNLDAMLTILKQMAFDMSHGVRVDYHQMFIEAERCDHILQGVDNSTLDETKLKEVKRWIYSVQNSAIELQVYQAVKNEQSKTGCVLVGIEANEDTADEAVKGFIAIDEKGKMAEMAMDRNGNVVASMVCEEEKALYWDATDGGVVEEQTFDQETQEYAYGGEYITVLLGSGYDPQNTDYRYSPEKGYMVQVNRREDGIINDGYTDEEGKYWEVKSETTNIKFGKNGEIEHYSESRYVEHQVPAPEGAMGMVTGKHEEVVSLTLESITQEDMNNRFNHAQKFLGSVNENGSQSE